MEFKNLEELLAKGQKLVNEDNYIEALSIYSKAFLLDPNNEEILRNSIFLWSRIQEGHYDFIPENSEQYLMRGISRFYKGEFHNSLEDYNKSIELNRSFDYAYKSRGMLYFYLQNYELAKFDLETAINIDPNNGEHWDNAASILIELRDFKNARMSYEKAVKLAPNSFQIWFNFGFFEEEYMNNDLEGLAKYNKAIELWPNYEDAIVNRNILLAKMGNQ